MVGDPLIQDARRFTIWKSGISLDDANYDFIISKGIFTFKSNRKKFLIKYKFISN